MTQLGIVYVYQRISLNIFSFNPLDYNGIFHPGYKPVYLGLLHLFSRWIRLCIVVVAVVLIVVISLPDDKILDWSKLKQNADDILTHYQTTKF